MIKKNNLDIPKTTINYVIICAGIIVIFLLVGLFPMYRYNIHQAAEIKKTKDQIVEIKAMGPIYLSLQNEMEIKDLYNLPNPKKTTITRGEAEKFPSVFMDLVKQSGLVAVSLTPDSSNMTGSSKILLHNAVVKGNFSNLRNMLIALSAISYLDRIADISISQRADYTEYKIQIWLALGA